MSAGDVGYRQAVHSAAQWFVRLVEQPDSPRLQADCAHWRAQHPDHERAWQRVSEVSAQAAALPAFAGRALRRPASPQRRAVVRALAAVALAVPLVSLTRASMTRGAWYRAGVGEQRTVRLADGSRLLLGTQSAVRVDAGAPAAVCVAQGDVMFDLQARAVQPPAPLLVRTAHGEILADGGCFCVRVQEHRTWVMAELGALQLRANGDAVTSTLAPGMQVGIDAWQVGLPSPGSDGALAWRDGILAADAMPLAAFLAELARYRHGIVRCDPTIADLTLSGAFHLGDTTQVLDMLPAVLPVRVRYLTPYWVMVLPRDVFT